jgi:hypothetical protein
MTEEEEARQLFLAQHPEFSESDFEHPCWALIDALEGWLAAVEQARTMAPALPRADLAAADAFAPRGPAEPLIAFRLRTGLRK